MFLDTYKVWLCIYSKLEAITVIPDLRFFLWCFFSSFQNDKDFQNLTVAEIIFAAITHFCHCFWGHLPGCLLSPFTSMSNIWPVSVNMETNHSLHSPEISGKNLTHMELTWLIYFIWLSQMWYSTTVLQGNTLRFICSEVLLSRVALLSN